jgi:hypothetical protein
MNPGHGNRTSRTDRHGAFAPIWSVLLAFLFYSAQVGPEVLDGLVHLEHRATRHPASTHFEDPGKQSHSDHCLLSQARGESRALPAPVAEPSRTVASDTAVLIPLDRCPVPGLSLATRARAPPVVAV